MLYGPDRLDRMAYGRSKHTDQRQPQRAGDARVGMRDRRGPWPVAGAQPGSSVRGDSYRGVRSETIPWLGEVSPDAPVRPLLAMTARSCGGRNPMGAPDSGDDASLWGSAPPCTAGPINDGSRSRPESRGHPHLPCLALDRSLCAPVLWNFLICPINRPGVNPVTQSVRNN